MNKYLFIILCIATLGAYAQAPETPAELDAAAPVSDQNVSAASNKNTNVKKMIGSANINLQTTVTGNQEQPRVMYILPWQSPLSPDLEMEMLSSQEDAVFGHVERDEMQRSLEAAGELDQADN